MYSRENRVGDLQCDVVCLGAGGAGLAAAVAAAELGAKVIVLEKHNSPGGNTARAQGFFSADSETQKRLKIEAPKDVLFKAAMSYAHWKINPRLMRAFINKSTDTLAWLQKQGLEVNEVWSLFPGQAIPTQHFPVGGGEGLIKALVNSCEKLGVRILYNTLPQQILMSNKGKTSGVVVKTEEKEITISARVVVIATGGYGGNKELLKKYCSFYSEDTLSPGLPNMGEGILMAIAAGAATEGLGTLQWLGPVFEGVAHGPGVWKDPVMIWVNKNGERFADESVGLNHFESVHAVLRQPDKVSFSVFDEEIKKNLTERIDKGLLRFRGLSSRPNTGGKLNFAEELQTEAGNGKVKISNSWEDIAAWIGADAKVLGAAIDEYNLSCDHGYDDLFLKDTKYLLPLRTPPYYAMRCRPIFLTTIGGIKINHKMEVINRNGGIIPGLYASGNDTGGWEPENCYNAYLSAHAFGFAINSGRIAGENAAHYLNQP